MSFSFLFRSSYVDITGMSENHSYSIVNGSVIIAKSDMSDDGSTVSSCESDGT